MTIKDCINKIQTSLAVLVEGAWVEPKRFPLKDGTTGLKFACPYCMRNYSRPLKKKEKCALIFQGHITPSGFRPYRFKCERCIKHGISIQQFLKEHYPLVYKEYSRERQAKNNDFKPKFG